LADRHPGDMDRRAYSAIRVCPVRRLHFWLHDRLLSMCLFVSFACVRQ